MVSIRRITAADAGRLRATRIAALTDSPSAFGSTLERELEFSDEEWAERARRAEAGSDRAMFLALDGDGGDEAVGIVGGFREDGSDSEIELVSMWVAPSHRGLGLGQRLVDEIVQWASDGGAATIGLWVTLGNNVAAALYRSLGFEEIDEFQPLPSDPCQNERRMRRNI